MPTVKVHDTVTEYLNQFDRRGLLYIESEPWDSKKLKAMRKKVREILSFPGNEGVLNESIHTHKEEESIRDSIREAISKMQRKSNDEYLLANDYFEFLRHRYNVRIMPFDRQLTSLERQLSIAKDMHDFNKAREFDKHEVAEKYMVSDKTIENDMRALREGISVMDQRLTLSDFQLRNRKVTAISTMHPIFLAQNLTQVVCMLEGLRRMEGEWAMQSYARNSAISIWSQLSEYARERITGTLVDLMNLDANWYQVLDKQASMGTKKMFYNEKETSDRFGRLMYAMKGSLPCSICYISDDDTGVEISGLITGMDEKSVRMLPESEEYEVVIDKNRILEVEVATQLR